MSSSSEADFTTLPEQRPLAPLPLGETVREVLGTLYLHAGDFMRLALVPVLIAFALTAAALSLTAGAWLRFFAMGVNLYLLVWFSGAVFRLLLRGPGRELSRPMPNWGPAEGRLVLRALGLMGLVMLATMPASMLFGSLGGGIGPEGPQPGVWMLGPLIIAVIVALGLSFTLPAAAVGRGYGYKRAWRESKGALTQLFGLFVMIVLPVDLAIALLDLLLLQLQLATNLVIPRAAVGTAANYLSVALATTVLAVAFARRTGWQRGKQTGMPRMIT